MLFITCKNLARFHLDPNYQSLQERVDGIELRLDLFDDINLDEIECFLASWKKKVIFTLRSGRQGGGFLRTEEEKLKIWDTLLTLHPDYVDIEYDSDPCLFALIKNHSSNPQLIVSYHNFIETPDLLKIYGLVSRVSADIYKIVSFARSTLDSLRMLELLLHAKQQGKKLIGICMGDLGEITRLLYSVVGGYLTFGSFKEEKTAPGQLGIDEFKRLGSETKVYGLIGYPIDKTLSPFVHNRIWDQKKIDAIYIKMPLQMHELDEFFSRFRSLHFFRGLSVTMPLKQEVYRFLDSWSSLAQGLGVINTIFRSDNRLIGDNTDMQGALTAIEKKMDLMGKKVVILGAGGASTALAFGCKQKGAHVCIAGRSKEKASFLASKIGCESSALSRYESYIYDLLINTTPESLPIMAEQIHGGACVMDINTFPEETDLLKESKKKGCVCIYGKEMFMYQALLQQQIWYGDCLERDELKQIIEPLLFQEAPEESML